MGYFANLYVIDITATSELIEYETSIYGADIEPRAYFTWGRGERPAGLFSYAHDTIFSDQELKLMPGYPLRERQAGEPERLRVEASFNPRAHDDPVLFHILLPERFVPRRDLDTLVQPGKPYIDVQQDRVIVTYPVVGPGEVRFSASQLEPGDSLNNFDLVKVLEPEERNPLKAEVEFNLGVFKLKLS
jgi:hypothetical protein